MTASKLFRVESFVASLAIKAPCKVATNTNITLSGEQTINSVAVVAKDRVLVIAQTVGKDNGIYDVSTSAWTRSADLDGGRDIARGTLVTVNGLTGQDFFYQVTTENPITIGTTALTFVLAYNPITLYSGAPQTLTGTGAVDITSGVTHIVTTGSNPLTLADGSNGQRKFIVMTGDLGAAILTPTNFGNGTAITFDDVGDSASLLFTNGAWHFMGGTATLIAPPGTVPKPFLQSDWINPPATPTVQLEQVGMPMTILEDAGEKPFLQTDWIMPLSIPTQEPLQIGKSIALV